ncbi:hypothetical protein AQJ30_15690 [Streptomyces longwoodensis]|uniref:Uncharacterized protein n=1 Tax=Streptomyces longwoodensis TaxID=68231 RepID=A0A101QX36_9ACTN|nr:hypothetical protein [Streptomyces longwoodensis]KUN37725.1 hypothetical protein AQJ30_15690 [Streptomyces longwoodensis]
MPKPNFGPRTLPEYKPSQEVRDALRAWLEAVDLEEERRKAARKALADDLKADPDLPFASMAAHPIVPWSEAMLRIIGAEYGVQPRVPNKAWKRKPAEDTPPNKGTEAEGK